MGAYAVETFMEQFPTYIVNSAGGGTDPGVPSGGRVKTGSTDLTRMTYGRFGSGVPGGCTIFYSQHVFQVYRRGWLKHYRGIGITDGNTYNHWNNLGHY